DLACTHWNIGTGIADQLPSLGYVLYDGVGESGPHFVVRGSAGGQALNRTVCDRSTGAARGDREQCCSNASRNSRLVDEQVCALDVNDLAADRLAGWYNNIHASTAGLVPTRRHSLRHRVGAVSCYFIVCR